MSIITMSAADQEFKRITGETVEFISFGLTRAYFTAVRAGIYFKFDGYNLTGIDSFTRRGSNNRFVSCAIEDVLDPDMSPEDRIEFILKYS